MRNLDLAISEWRREIASAGIKSAEVLDELESHLRDDVERRMRSGTDAADALRMATKQFGAPSSLKAEFERIENSERKYMKRGLIITAGIIGVLVGLALVMPAVAQYRQLGAMRNDEPWLFLIGSLLTLGGCFASARGIKKKRA